MCIYNYNRCTNFYSKTEISGIEIHLNKYLKTIKNPAKGDAPRQDFFSITCKTVILLFPIIKALTAYIQPLDNPIFGN